MASMPTAPVAPLTATGPRSSAWAQRAGHDINYAAMAGALHACGPDNVPVNLIADIGGGALYACSGIGAALFARASSGKGCVVDVAMVASSAHLLSAVYGRLQVGAWNDAPAANVIDGGIPWYRTYRTRDDRHMAVGAIEQRFYDALLLAMALARTGLIAAGQVRCARPVPLGAPFRIDRRLRDPGAESAGGTCASRQPAYVQCGGSRCRTRVFCFTITRRP
jgi:crotonobetainyl-CoA:carnitine CoA-transferase CaiB-like acyl-CoA transferase